MECVFRGRRETSNCYFVSIICPGVIEGLVVGPIRQIHSVPGGKRNQNSCPLVMEILVCVCVCVCARVRVLTHTLRHNSWLMENITIMSYLIFASQQDELPLNVCNIFQQHQQLV